MPTICLSRSKHLIPFVALLKRAGEPVDRKLSEARLPGHCLDDPETVIPAELLFHFRELCGQALGQDDIALEATRDLQIPILGEFGKALLAAPTLYRLLTTLRDHFNTHSTHHESDSTLRTQPVDDRRQAWVLSYHFVPIPATQKNT